MSGKQLIFLILGIAATTFFSFLGPSRNKFLTRAAAGDLDPTFGDGGRVITDFYGGYDSATSAALQTEGKIIIAGTATVPVGYGYKRSFGIVRYTNNGVLDQSFGNNGRATTVFRQPDPVREVHSYITKILVKPDGKIVALGNAGGFYYWNNDGQDAAIAIYSDKGILEAKEFISVDNSGAREFINDGKIQPDGKILAAGAVQLYPNYSSSFLLFRLNQAGRLDNSFNGNGKRIVSFGSGADSHINSVAVQPDGKIIAAGSVIKPQEIGNHGNFALARVNTDGSLDNSFGTNGRVITDLGTGAGINSILVLSDSKLLAVGSVSQSNGSLIAIARYNPDGSLDTSFGSGGIVTTGFDGFVATSAQFAEQQGEKILVVGKVYPGELLAAVRYNRDGALDTTFSSGGKIVVDVSNFKLGGFVIQPDGKLLGVGWATIGSQQDFATARLLIATNTLPTANAGPDLIGDEGQALTFNGSGSTDPDNNIASYAWDFGDGGTGMGEILAHTYDDNGTYTATLTVTDSEGEISTDTTAVTVNNAAPTVGAISGQTAPLLPGETASSSASLADPGIIDTHTTEWDWGDGTKTAGTITDDTVTGSHTYATAGVYTITLTVTDKDGGSGQSTFQLTVQTPAQASQSLTDLIESTVSQQGIQDSLEAKLGPAVTVLTDSNTKNDSAAIKALQAFINQVEAQRVRSLTNEQADVLIAGARRIIASLSL